jgi:hypothetical protein
MPEVWWEVGSCVSATKRWKLAWQKCNGGNASWFVMGFVNLDSALALEPGSEVTLRSGDVVTVREVFSNAGILYVSNCPE